MQKFMSFKIILLFLCLTLLLAGCNGNPDSAETGAGAKSENDPQALTELAVKKQEIGAFDEAVEILQKALSTDPNFVPAHHRMGLVYEEGDKRPEAISAYQKVLTLEPQHIAARLGLATVYGKQNRNDLAIVEYLKVAKLKPDDLDLHFKIALEYWYIQNLPKSAEYYNKVIGLNPDHMQAHLNLASVYQKMKDGEKAIQEIEIVLKLAHIVKDEQATSIAKKKLAFFVGRKDMTQEEYDRKTQPPFE
jgi:tetratricopeptide (TPR) repeat protein